MSETRAAARRAGRIALVVALVLAVAGIFQHDLWTADEPREAEIGRSMLLSGFSAVPTLAGEPFMEKPPLFAWCVAASYRLFGVSAGAARVPAALFGLGALWVAFALGRRAGGRIAGLCAVVVLATMAQFVQTTHKAILDTALVCFVGAGHLALLRLRTRPAASAYVALAAASGLAFLSKSWVGPGLICAPPILASLVQRDGTFLRRVAPAAVAASTAGVLLFGLPWVLALAAAPNGGWDRVHECLVVETLGRSVGGVEQFEKGAHAHGPLYYLPAVLSLVAPWTVAVPAMLRSGVLHRTSRGGRAGWMALVFVAGVVLLSVPSGKRSLYLVPLLPVLAGAAGVWLSRAGSRRGGPWDRATLLALAAALVVAGGGILWAATGLPLPDAVRDVITDTVDEVRRSGALAAAAVGALAAALGARALLLRGGPLPRLAWTVAAGVVALFAGYLSVLRPAMNPVKELRTGALAAAALVPEPEPILGLDCDETTRAVLSFYSGRTMTHVSDARIAADLLASGRAHHLVLARRERNQAKPWRLPKGLEERFRLVGTVGLAQDREVAVFEYAGP